VQKKILGIAIILVFVAILIAPVFADPTKGQKAAITLTWTRTKRIQGPPRFTGNVMHRDVYVEWSVVLEIEGGPTLTGTAKTERKNVRVPQPDGANLVLRDYYELWFATQGGGFEGNALVMLEGFMGGGVWEKSKAHGLFQGTDAFEGQTLNAGHGWKEQDGGIVWTGYLLKYPLPP
jgi:hypothetical protein